MVRFLENHDEQRIASPQFAGNVQAGIPGMVLAATLSAGPVLIYSGQESGETGLGKAGFQSDDGRTSIFDYWGLPEHQKWMNEGRFDGGLLSPEQRSLRAFYGKLFRVCQNSPAITCGDLLVLHLTEDHGFAFIRHHPEETMLVLANLSPEKTINSQGEISEAQLAQMGRDFREDTFWDCILGGKPQMIIRGGAFLIHLGPYEAEVYRMSNP